MPRLVLRRMVRLVVATSVLLPVLVYGQTDETQDTLFIYIPTFDTTKVHSLGEMTVDGYRAPSASEAMTQRVTLAQLARRDAYSVDEVMRIIPAAHVQTNSRGETLVYLRNAGERQVALFFDGAPINVPWDNRMDLSFIPPGMLQNLNVVKGAPSLLYGPNTMGGVVNMMTRELESEGRYTEISSQGGTPGRAKVLLTHLVRDRNLSSVGSVGFSDSKGFRVPSGVDLPFGQDDSSVRLNTDASIRHGFFRLAYDLPNDGQAAVAFLHIDGDKGVAPEGHKDPEVSKVRYWRYPDWHNTLLIGSGQWKSTSGNPLTLRASVWNGRFGQTIEQYASDRYRRISETQFDKDRTLGARLIAHKALPLGAVRLAAIGWTAKHDMRIVDADAPLDCCEETAVFKQHTMSAGAEYEAPLTRRSDFFGGINVDAVRSPTTATGGLRETRATVGWSSGISWRLTSGWRAKGRVGSRTRLPTMRERFDTALGKFVLNPDLKPERSYVAELGIDRRSGGLASELVLFGSITDNLIDQEVVTVDGKKRRRRVNLNGSRLLGVEWVGSLRYGPALGIEAHFTYTYGRAYDEESGRYTRKLQERPNVIGRAAVLSRLPGKVRFTGELELAGQSYSLNEENEPVPLGWAPRIHTRLSRLFRLPGSFPLFLEVFARANNLTDTNYTPQLGLPEPGRSLEAGVKLSM